MHGLIREPTEVRVSHPSLSVAIWWLPGRRNVAGGKTRSIAFAAESQTIHRPVGRLEPSDVDSFCALLFVKSSIVSLGGL